MAAEPIVRNGGAEPDSNVLATSPWSLTGTLVVAEFELRVLWSTKANLVGTLLIQPIVYMVLLTAGLQSLIGDQIELQGGNYITYVFPGLLALQTIRAFTSAIYRSTAERRWGQLALKRLSGVGPLGYVLGMTPAYIVAFCLQALVMVPIGVWLGVRFTFPGLPVTVLLGAFLLFFWTALALLITAVIRDYQQRDLVISLAMLPLMFSAPVFFVLADAPRFLQVVAIFNPLTYQVLAMRDAFNNHVFPTTLLLVAGISVLAVAVATISVARSDLIGSERG